MDGAHVPGHLPLDLEALGADVYAGNCHKWLCAPKGSGFLWARPEHQDWIEPLVVSWGYHEDADFGERHGWQGTRDPAAFLAVPKAIEVHATFDLGGCAGPRGRGRAPARAARPAAVCGARGAVHARAHGATLPAAELLRATVVRRAPRGGARVRVGGPTLLRVSIGPYNDEADVERLVDAVRRDSRSVIQSAIQTLLDGHDLAGTRRARSWARSWAARRRPAQIGGFLVALRAKGETADEIAGCAEAMRAHVLAVAPTREDVVDVVGTGGDGARTFNISTTAAIVAAAAGAAVAKHGNRAVSSVSGSADVLEALGFTLEQSPERIAESIDTLGFGFMFAPPHHPAMRHAAPVRRELGTRTIFNVLGPLTNPAGARAGRLRRLCAGGRAHGRRSARRPRVAARLRRPRGERRSTSSRRPGRTSSSRSPTATVRERIVDPLELGIEPCDPSELAGGSPEENARTARDVLDGRARARRATPSC